MLTNQQMFDRVSVHLLKQDKAARVKDNCAYRGENNLTCAIGSLIPDKVYLPKFEGNTCGMLIEVWPRAMSRCGIGKRNLDLANRLQIVHDSYAPDEWPAELRFVANEFNLSTNAMNGVSKMT